MAPTSTPANPRRHPLFARFYARVQPAMDQGGVNEHREALLKDASGRALEVGVGTGANFAHYPPTVTEVIAVEPEPYLRHVAETAASNAPVPITVIDGHAEHLPVDDQSFDTAIACLMLCSVIDRDAALAEMYRALRPGGRLHFFEHARAETLGLARLQRILDATIWPILNGGCHLATDTHTAIERAGFTYDHKEHILWPDSRPPLPFAPHVFGTATRPTHAGHPA